MALAQVNPTIGDFDGNRDLIIASARRAASAGAELACLPDLALTGAPLKDLAQRHAFIRQSGAALQRLAAELAETGLARLHVTLGHLDASAPGGTSVAVLTGGQVFGGGTPMHRQICGTGVHLCTAAGAAEAAEPAELRVIVDRLPFDGRDSHERHAQWAAVARRQGYTLAWSNLVGGPVHE